MVVVPPPGAALPPVRRERQTSFLLPFLAACFVVVLGAVLAIVLIRNSTSGSDAAAGPTTQLSTAPRSTRAMSSASAAPTSSTRSTSKAKPTPSSKSKTTSTKAKPTPKPKPTRRASAPTAQELTKAITDYYSLVPGNTEAGWQLLTDKYRRTTAKSRAEYERFWGSMRRVTISDVVAQPPGTVVATLTYYPRRGERAVNRTRFALVRDGGVLKIDASQVI